MAHVAMSVMHTRWVVRATVGILVRAIPLRSTKSALRLEISPSLHRDFAGVELSLATMTGLVRFLGVFAGGLTRVSPGEVVEVPEGVDWKDEVPDGEREQVDQHPEDVGQAVGGDDDENSRQTKDEGE
jgi:hypothetical protein